MDIFSRKNRITALALTSDSRYAVSASDDKKIKVWDVHAKTIVRTLRGHTAGVNDVALTPDNSRILSASDDGTVKIWDLASGTDLFTFCEHHASVSCLAVSADGRQAVSVSSSRYSKDTTLKLWDVESGFVRRSFPTDDDFINALALTPNGKHALTASMLTRHVFVWDIARGEYILGFCSDTGSRKMDVAISPDGHFGVSCGDCGDVNYFDIENGLEIFKLYHFEVNVKEPNYWQNPGLMIWNVGFFDNGRSIMSCSYDGTIKIWDIESKRLQSQYYLGTLLTACAISSDGLNIIAGDDNGQMYFIKPK
jgi:WD40 repeat protein